MFKVDITFSFYHFDSVTYLVLELEMLMHVILLLIKAEKILLIEMFAKIAYFLNA